MPVFDSHICSRQLSYLSLTLHANPISNPGPILNPNPTLVHLLSTFSGVSLVDAIGAYLRVCAGLETAHGQGLAPGLGPGSGLAPGPGHGAAQGLGLGMGKAKYVGINGFATLRQQPNNNVIDNNNNSNSSSNDSNNNSGSSSHYHYVHVVKMKVGDIDGSGHLEDAARVSAYVDNVLGLVSAPWQGLAQEAEVGVAGLTSSSSSSSPSSLGRWLRLDANRSWTLSQVLPHMSSHANDTLAPVLFPVLALALALCYNTPP